MWSLPGYNIHLKKRPTPGRQLQGRKDSCHELQGHAKSEAWKEVQQRHDTRKNVADNPARPTVNETEAVV